jgi:hypothetical protein
MTSIVYPIMHQKTFTDALKNTTLPEGDLMRLLMQMLDRLEQVDRASDDSEMAATVRNCKHLFRDLLSGVGIF